MAFTIGNDVTLFIGSETGLRRASLRFSLAQIFAERGGKGGGVLSGHRHAITQRALTGPHAFFMGARYRTGPGNAVRLSICCRSSVVERILGKAEVVSSILTGSTIV
jgi:hypothetical protein